jgi:hypothetical protein
MTIDEFIRSNQCKVLYHMSEKNQWTNIQKLGLWSTSALLDICGYTGDERLKIESQLRRNKVSIKHPTHGVLVLRDQVPMFDWPEQGIYLDKLLEDNVTRQDWLKFLNGKIFFWVSRYELNKMLCARQYRDKPQWIITVDTRALLEQYVENAYVSDQNTGSLYSGRKRGPSTFMPFVESPVKSNIIELAIDYGIPNISDFTISVTEYVGTKVDGERVCREIKQIWARKSNSRE